jgi:uncharacterized ferritin-like protein (DUF455 family)
MDPYLRMMACGVMLRRLPTGKHHSPHNTVLAHVYVCSLISEVKLRYMALAVYVLSSITCAKHAQKLIQTTTIYTSFIVYCDTIYHTLCELCNSLLARLAIINMLHEARGLDVFPLTLKKFRNNRDEESVQILEKNFSEEIYHVATGLKWFKFLCNEQSQYNYKAETEFNNDGSLSCIEIFHSIVGKFHTGIMKKDTLNREARAMAGMTGDWVDALYS